MTILGVLEIISKYKPKFKQGNTTALMLGCGNGRTEAVKMLLEQGTVDVNRQDEVSIAE